MPTKDQSVGRIKTVELREIWEKEANGFSKWLYENIDYLNEALNLDLEVLEAEKRVDDSRFSIDILAELQDGSRVIIENQLEKSDHTHLGQILTYSTNIEAPISIWICREPRQEHINVINYLNENLENRCFYLLKIEAIQIGDSDPAPLFTIVCQPEEEIREIGKTKKILESTRQARRKRRESSDTLIVPARKDGFERVFLGENCWYSIRIREERIPQLKYIAGYQVAPISAVTHLAEIKEIVRSHEDDSKWKVIFKSPASEIKHIPVGKGAKVQSPVYCELEKLKASKTIADAISTKDYNSKKKVA